MVEPEDAPEPEREEWSGWDTMAGGRVLVLTLAQLSSIGTVLDVSNLRQAQPAWTDVGLDSGNQSWKNGQLDRILAAQEKAVFFWEESRGC